MWVLRIAEGVYLPNLSFLNPFIKTILGHETSPRSTSSALKVSVELGFPLLDLRVDYHDSSVDELIRIYRHSQSEWAQEWRDSMNDLPEMNMKREFRVA